MRLRAMAGLAALCCMVPAARAADWPQFRGPNGNGISTETIGNRDWATKPPQQLWQLPLTDNGFGGPAVVGGRVYLLDQRGDNTVVRVINVLSGEQRWEYAFPQPGRENWGFTRSTPAVSDGRVYAVGRFGRVVCLTADSGQLLWQKELTTDFGGRPPSWGYAPSPLIDGNTLILLPGGGRGNMVALDKVTGATRWQGGGTDGAGYATPTIATIGGVRQYVAMTAKAVIGVQPDNGQLLWRQEWPTSNDVNAAMPVVFNDQVFVTAGYNHGCGLVKVAANQAALAWENKAIIAHFSSPVMLNGYIYGDSDPDHLVCLDPNTGEIKWRQPGFEKGGLTVVGGLIVAMSGRTGDVMLVDPQPTGYKELGRLKTMGGPNAWTAPVVAYGKLLVRNRTTLACYDLN